MKTKVLRICIGLIFLLILGGCTHEEQSNAHVSIRYDAKTVYLRSDKECNIYLIVDVIDGTNTTIIQKNVSLLGGGQTLNIQLEEIEPTLFSNNAKISSATTTSPTVTQLDWWGWGILIIILATIFACGTNEYTDDP